MLVSVSFLGLSLGSCAGTGGDGGVQSQVEQGPRGMWTRVGIGALATRLGCEDDDEVRKHISNATGLNVIRESQLEARFQIASRLFVYGSKSDAEVAGLLHDCAASGHGKAAQFLAMQNAKAFNMVIARRATHLPDSWVSGSDANSHSGDDRLAKVAAYSKIAMGYPALPLGSLGRLNALKQYCDVALAAGERPEEVERVLSEVAARGTSDHESAGYAMLMLADLYERALIHSAATPGLISALRARGGALQYLTGEYTSYRETDEQRVVRERREDEERRSNKAFERELARERENRLAGMEVRARDREREAAEEQRQQWQQFKDQYAPGGGIQGELNRQNERLLGGAGGTTRTPSRDPEPGVGKTVIYEKGKEPRVEVHQPIPPNSTVTYEKGKEPRIETATPSGADGGLKPQPNTPGQKNGWERTFFDDGRVQSEVYYVNGKKNGEFRRYVIESLNELRNPIRNHYFLKESGQYENDQRTGEWKQWATSEYLDRPYLEQTQWYGRGRLNGTRTRWASAAFCGGRVYKSLEEEYVDGELSGEKREYTYDCKLKIEQIERSTMYRFGKKNGPQIEYRNGVPYSTTNYIDGETVGK
jgi:antitoxin component YwqK of YwqJK toxin-antitoxin module